VPSLPPPQTRLPTGCRQCTPDRCHRFTQPTGTC
jgi:hypothetical protein